MNSVLLTVDLTKAVADEAIERKDSVVIAYRKCHLAIWLYRPEPLTTPHPTDPIIFRGLKSLTFNDTQQTSLLRLAAEGISVR
jgi:putative NIF3 family GTP cyclohydrolase 1 type 2